jgi:hypothetical protein
MKVRDLSSWRAAFDLAWESRDWAAMYKIHRFITSD